MRIGFVGLGCMGQAMAQRLLETGHTLKVHNRTASRADPLVAAGAQPAESPAAAARGCDIAFSMVSDDQAARSVASGEHGIVEGLGDGGLHISCSTISVALAQELTALHADRGQRFVSATVLGRPPAARDGSLFVVAAGAAEAIRQASPALDAIGRRTFLLGEDPWRANLLKLSLNFLIFSTIEQMAEVFALNEKAGTATATVFDVLVNSFFDAPVHRNYGALIVERRFDNPNASITLAAKDIAALLQAGDALDVPLPIGSLLRDRLLASIARGGRDLDFSSLSDRAREDAGLPPAEDASPQE